MHKINWDEYRTHFTVFIAIRRIFVFFLGKISNSMTLSLFVALLLRVLQ